MRSAIPLKMLKVAVTGVRNGRGPMAPDIALDKQRPAEIRILRHVETKLAEIAVDESRAKERAGAA